MYSRELDLSRCWHFFELGRCGSKTLNVDIRITTHFVTLSASGTSSSLKKISGDLPTSVKSNRRRGQAAVVVTRKALSAKARMMGTAKTRTQRSERLNRTPLLPKRILALARGRRPILEAVVPQPTPTIAPTLPQHHKQSMEPELRHLIRNTPAEEISFLSRVSHQNDHQRFSLLTSRTITSPGHHNKSTMAESTTGSRPRSRTSTEHPLTSN